MGSRDHYGIGGINMGKSDLDPIDCKSSLVMNAVRVLGADNVPPAEACTASECICCFV